MGKRRNKIRTKDLSQFNSDLLECRYSPILGRHLVAKRQIKAGELLLKETYLIAGPTLSTTTVVCIGCHSDIPIQKCKIYQKCLNCSWYICKDTCSKLSPFHTPTECSFLAEMEIKPPDAEDANYGIISVLRCLLLKLFNADKWDELISLQNHIELRKLQQVWKENKAIVDQIRKKWGLRELFTTDEIFNICGVLDVNGFEMGDMCSFAGIFYKSSMITHDCVPNSAQNENIDGGFLEVNAIQDIPSEAVITVCYDASLEGTRWRRKELHKSKYFVCNCDRCADPTEFGTNFSCLICTVCEKGYLTELDHSDINEDVVWTCHRCRHKVSATNVDNLCEEYKKLGQTMDKNIETREEFLKLCKSIFHLNHFIPFKIKFNLCLAYGRENGFSLGELRPAQVARKLDLCISVMSVLDKLCPGLSVARGNILYEIQATQVLNVKLCIASEKYSRRLIMKRLSVAKTTLMNAIEIFEIHYALRMLAKEAKDVTLVELTKWIQQC